MERKVAKATPQNPLSRPLLLILPQLGPLKVEANPPDPRPLKLGP